VIPLKSAILNKLFTLLCCAMFFILSGAEAYAQMITGVWSGKINRQKVEVKVIQKGDSLTGTSYYYESPGNYRRYRIKGYFDATTNEAVWWDDYLLEQKPASTRSGLVPLLSRADFNCPGDGKMMLDGKAARKEDEERSAGEVHLNKTGTPIFTDEWDFVIENYTAGGNDPDLIDSIAGLTPFVETAPPVAAVAKTPVIEPVKQTQAPTPTITTPVPEETKLTVPVSPPRIEEKFASRKKVLVTEIPVTGDSIELRFYDNAEIDGESLSLFLDNQLLYRNIRLTGNAYIIKLAVNQLNENSELTMVAENLGSIPPNTSLMVALVGEKRYEARLESTEGSSAMVKFRK
jgi:hypothetical protein